MEPIAGSIQIGKNADGDTVIVGEANTVTIYRVWREAWFEPEAGKERRGNFGPNPYRGLSPFREGEAAHFFGRDRLVDELLKRSADMFASPKNGGDPWKMLTVLGPSGSGKTSVVRAGLIPGLARHPLPGVKTVSVLLLTPDVHPLGSLAAVLADMARKRSLSEDGADEFERLMRQRDGSGSAVGLREIVREFSRLSETSVLIVVDQLEELFTLCMEDAERRLFSDNLIALASDPVGRAGVTATLGIGFIHEVDHYPPLSQAVSRRPVLVPSMVEHELRQVIELPAENAGSPLDAAAVEQPTDLLVEQMREAGRVDEYALPLLEFTLSKIWNAMDEGIPPVKMIKELNGLAGAPAHEAEKLYAEFEEKRLGHVVKKVFLSLVSPGERIRRRRVRLTEMEALDEKPESVKAVLRRFSDESVGMITILRNPDGEETAEITNDALFRHWGRMKDWIDEEMADIRLQQRIFEAAEQWKRNGYPPELLWVSSDLDVLKAYRKRAAKAMNPEQEAFYGACLKREIRGRLKRWGSVALMSLITLFSIAVAFRSLLLQAKAEEAGILVEADNDRLRKQKEIAIDAINEITYDIVETLNDISGADPAMRHILAANSEILESIFRLDPDTVKAKRERAFTMTRLASAAMTAGDIPEASKYCREAYELFKTISESYPEDPEARRDLSMCCNKLGDLYLRLGETADALRTYRQAVKISRSLTEVESGNTEVMRDLSISLERIGDLYLRLGESEKALHAYEQVVEINLKLVKAEPDNTTNQRDLSLSYNKLGDLHLEMGETKKAVFVYSQSLEICRRLAEADPKSAKAQRDLSVSHERVGDLHLRLGETKEALRSYKQSLEISRALARSNPDSPSARRDLSVSYNKLGDLHLRQGETQEALKAYKQALEISRNLAEADPGNAKSRRDLSVSHERLGDLHLRMGKTEEARESYKHALEISRALAEGDPRSTEARRDLSVSYNKLGDLYLRQGETKEALTAYQQALEISRNLAEADPESPETRRDLSVSHERLGDLYLRLGKNKEALRYYQQDLEITKALAETDPNNAEARRDLLVSYYKMGLIQDEMHQTDQALSYYRQSLKIAEKLAEDKMNQQAQNDLAVLESLVKSRKQGEK